MIKKIRKIITILLSAPKTIYFNLKYLPLKDAVKFPIIVSHRVVLRTMKGEVVINSPIKTGMIKIGFGELAIFDGKYSRTIWQNSGTVVFNGKASLGQGTKLTVGGTLIFGKNFSVTAESQFICKKRMVFGDDVLISWQNLFMDSDLHKIETLDGTRLNPDRDVIIGNHVWIGCRCTILKGSRIGDNVIVASNSRISGDLSNYSECVIGGVDSVSVLKSEVNWIK